MQREHRKSQQEAMNIVQEAREERVDRFQEKKKCPVKGCRVRFSIKKSLCDHLVRHGWSSADIQEVVSKKDPLPSWLYMNESESED
jgi:hypothetical protein